MAGNKTWLLNTFIYGLDGRQGASDVSFNSVQFDANGVTYYAIYGSNDGKLGFSTNGDSSHVNYVWHIPSDPTTQSGWGDNPGNRLITFRVTPEGAFADWLAKNAVLVPDAPFGSYPATRKIKTRKYSSELPDGDIAHLNKEYIISDERTEGTTVRPAYSSYKCWQSGAYTFLWDYLSDALPAYQQETVIMPCPFMCNLEFFRYILLIASANPGVPPTIIFARELCYDDDATAPRNYLNHYGGYVVVYQNGQWVNPIYQTIYLTKAIKTGDDAEEIDRWLEANTIEVGSRQEVELTKLHRFTLAPANKSNLFYAIATGPEWADSNTSQGVNYYTGE